LLPRQRELKVPGVPQHVDELGRGLESIGGAVRGVYSVCGGISHGKRNTFLSRDALCGGKGGRLRRGSSRDRERDSNTHKT